MPKTAKKAQTGLTVTRSRVAEVMKADPQMGTVLANIQSLLQQLQSMAGAEMEGADGGAGPIQMEEDSTYAGPTFRPGTAAPKRVEGEEEDEEGEEEATPQLPETGSGVSPAEIDEKKKVVRGRAKKAIIVGDPDASTGSGEAEERIEDIPEWDEENIDQIAKGILRMLTKGAVARKSAAQGPDATTQALGAITQAMGTVAKQVRMQGKVLTDMMEGLGVTKGLDDFEAAHPPEKRPVQTTDQALVMKEFVNALAAAMRGAAPAQGQEGGEAPASQAEVVRKSVGDITQALAGFAGEAWYPKGR